VSYVTQRDNLLPWRTVEANIALPFEFGARASMTAGERKERVQKMLKKVGLETAGKIQLRKYSKGMLQRVGLAQAILHDRKLVILDEPMSGLDPVGRREVRDIIMELKNAGKTILFSTHILSDAETLCDRVGVIAGGIQQPSNGHFTSFRCSPPLKAP
jgi:ABC-2 type transport system ATP-binding protein